MKKRILPALLALCMVMSLLPVAVFADITPESNKCQCTNTSCTNSTTHSSASSDGACTANPVNGDTKCADCGGVEKFACTCTGNCKDGDGHVDGHSEGYTLNAAGVCSACQTAIDAAGGGDEEEDPVTACETCGCDLSVCSKCKAADVEADTAAVCGCATAPCGATGCTYSKCTDVTCDKYGMIESNHVHAHAATCVSGGKANSYKTDCAGTDGVHYAGCPNICGVQGCNKTKGHETTGADDTAKKHSNTTACTNDAGCPSETNHVMTCPKYTAPTADENSGELIRKTGEEYTFEETCSIATHVNVEGKTEKKFDVKVSISYEYYQVMKADPADGTKKVVDEDATATAKTTAQSSAQAAAKAQWEAVNSPVVCSVCAKAANDASVQECTGAADCNVSGKHKADCLSLCTHNGDTCPNTIGKSEAHQVWYRVEKVVGETITQEGTFDNRDAAVARLTALREGAEDGVRYQMVAEHCPRAGVADSVALGADETAETTDPTTPEVKAPEKAEDFADLKGDEWYAEELTALVEKGIFTGSLDDGKYSFNATGNVTGAELVVLLSRVAGEDLVTTGTEWNKAATAWAAEAGYTEGVDITTTGKLTRQDVILILWRAAGSPASEQSLEDFADAEGLEGDYLTAMKWAVEKEIIKGDGDTGALNLKADTNITRAEMVAVLTRYSNVK